MADDNTVEVKFGAQTAEIESGSKKASDAVKQSMDQMKSSMDSMKSNVASFQSEITSHFNTITDTIQKVQTAFVAMAAVFAGGALFKGVVDEFVNLNSEAKNLSTVMGSTIQDAQAFAVTFNKFGVSTETVTSMMMRMTRQLKSNEDGFNANGVATRDATGAMLPMEQITLNVIDRLTDMKGGYDANALSQMAFGRGIQDITALLKISKGAIEETKQRLADLGMTLDDTSAAKARAFKEGMHDLTLVGEALKYKIGAELIPVLIQMGKFFAEEGPAAIHLLGDAFAWIRETMMSLTIIVAQIRNGFLEAWEKIQLGAAAAFNIIKATVSGNMAEAAAAAKTAYASMEASSKKWAEQAVRDANDVKFAVLNAMQAQSSGGVPGDWRPKPKADKPDAGGDAYVGKGKKDGGGGKGGGESDLQAWQNELDQKKLAEKAFQDQTLAMEKTFWASKLEMGQSATKAEEDALKAAEKAAATARLVLEQEFWKGKLALLDSGTKDYDAVQHKIVTLEGQINKARVQSEIDTIKAKIEAGKEGLKDYEALITQQEKLDKIALQMKQEDIKHAAQLGKLTKAQELTEYKQLLVQEQAADKARAAQELAQIKKTLGEKSIEYKNYYRKIEVMDKEQLLAMQKANDAVAEAEASTWTNLAGGMLSSFTTAIEGMMKAGADFGSVMAALGQSILNVFVNMVSKIVEEWIKGMIMSLIETKVTDSAKVLSQAGVAGAAGVASVMATIPFPLNLALAPEVGAAAFAMAADYAVAERGWDVPSDSMAMLHANEMVLPASLADNVRNMAGGGASKVTVNLAPNINYRMSQSEWNTEAKKMVKAINRELSRFGKNPLGPSYA